MRMRLIYSTTFRREVQRKSGPVSVTRRADTLAIRRGQKLFVKEIVGHTVNEELADLKELDDGHCLLTFKQDAIIRVEGLNQNMMTCHHLRFARPNQPQQQRSVAGEKSEANRGRLFHNHVTRFGRLLAALLQSGERPIHVPGGLRYAVARCHDQNGQGGEIIVAAPKRGVTYKEDGEIPTGYIVGTEEIDDLLESLPPRAPRE